MKIEEVKGVVSLANFCKLKNMKGGTCTFRVEDGYHITIFKGKRICTGKGIKFKTALKELVKDYNESEKEETE